MRLRTLGWTLALLSISTPAAGQETTPPDRAAVLKAAQEVAARARFCSFITLSEDGQPHARVIDLFPVEDDFTAWIGTGAGMRKVREVQRDPRATLLCFDPEHLAYVALVGTAAVVSDPVEKARRWKPEWKQYYTDENRGPDYLLIRLTTASVEIVSEEHGFPIAFSPTTLKLK